MRHYDLPPMDQLEAFDASARHLSFTKAAEELSLTQSAVSRQIAALEAHYALPLFRRLHRALRLTDDGQRLYLAVSGVLAQLHLVGTELKRERGLKTVVVTTTPGFAGLWLIPRLVGFLEKRPDVDVRISATYDLVSLNRDGVDLAIRYTDAEHAGPAAQRLFGEVVFPVCSPKLVNDATHPLKRPQDLRWHALLQKDSDAVDSLQHWSMWLRATNLDELKPVRTLRFSMYDQLIQAAVNGQGVALGRSPLVDDLLRQGKLVIPFEAACASPRGYYLLQASAAARKPEVQEFVAWLRGEIEREAAPAASSPRVVDVPAGGERGGPQAPLRRADRRPPRPA
jgi:LysR family glycine cleavage system transcriptional activator